jgi:hypothetical protein
MPSSLEDEASSVNPVEFLASASKITVVRIGFQGPTPSAALRQKRRSVFEQENHRWRSPWRVFIEGL